MIPKLKQKDIITVKQYITDKKGQKKAAIIDMDELVRVEKLLEDLSDLKIIEDRVAEPTENYGMYSRRRKSRTDV